MKKLITLLFVIMAAQYMVANDTYVPAPESLKYRVMYKWGLINKQAGTVTVTTHNFADGYFSSTLIGHSAKWADKFYTVRDTLLGTIMADRLEPIYYERIAHEGGAFKRDIITYDRTTPTIKGNCQLWRPSKGKSKEMIHSTKLLTGTGTTLDMLSSFYYMRHIDYPSMQPGQNVVTNIYSGSKKETLKITYKGTKQIQSGGQSQECYYIIFSFTTGNGKKSSDDCQAWISADSQRIPLLMVGDLPIGSIRCYYEP